ncbi:MAG: hypothetical protein WC623_16040 [Pedobacter sp.]|uniref:hypothetical protein n=1 Tax=Pedobacter sp. TaxID=1411316 RepID=UPI003566F907
MNPTTKLTHHRELFKNYNKNEIDSLLWDMYKGWFLYSATEIDSDKQIDMLLFYDEVKNLLLEYFSPTNT